MPMTRPSIRSGTPGRTAAESRRGAVLILAMIGLLLVSMIGVTVLRMTLHQRRHLRDEELRTQTQWLIEAGLERAVARLRQDEGYTGDVWKIPAYVTRGKFLGLTELELSMEPTGILPQEVTARVTTQVPEAGEDNLRQITVEAKVTIDGQQQARITQTFLYRPVDDDDSN